MCNFYIAVWALNVKMTDPLVATAGSALSKSGHGRSRDLWAMSGTHVSVSLLRYLQVSAAHVKLSTGSEKSACKKLKLCVASMDLVVKMADLLVATVELSAKNYPPKVP